MILKRLTLQGFKSFLNESTFLFPQKEGLYFIAGRNELEPDLEANGSGKSTILDAILFCFFNKTARFLKATEIEPWGEVKAKTDVKVEFSLDESDYILKRTRSPNTLKLKKNNEEFKTVEQTDVESLIKFNFEEFLLTVIFGQQNDMFFDKKPSEIMELLVSVLNLEKWDERSDEARRKNESCFYDLNELDKKIIQLSSTVEVLKTTDYSTDVEEFEIQKQSDISKLTNDILNVEKEFKDIIELIKVVTSDFCDFSPQMQIVQNDLNEIKKIESEIQAEINDFLVDKRSYEKDLTLVGNKVKKINLLGVTCKECLQSIDEQHKLKHLQEYDSEKLNLTTRLSDLSETLEKLQNDLKVTLDTKKEVESELSVLKQKKMGYEYKLEELRNKKSNFERTFESSKKKLELLKLKENPFLSKQNEACLKIEKFKKEVLKLEEMKSNLQKNADAYKYWIKSFKDIRLEIVNEMLAHLQFEVNNSIFHLGLKDWKIEFSVDKESKSGSIQKKFTMMVFSPYNANPVPWESWSGGESQRLRMAGCYGMINLICARKGIFPNIEFYDEPSSGLNQKGITDLIESLKNRALEYKKVIFIIDHRNLEANVFDGIYTIIKDGNGSRIE